MKKIIPFTFLLLSISFLSNAQILNGQFEDWTTATSGTYSFDSLSHWKTTELFSLQNSGNTNHSAQREITDVYEGSSALKLTSWSTTGFPINGLPGCASNGDVVVVTIPPSVTPVGGVPDVTRHAALVGYYEYIPVSSDRGSIETCLFKWNGTSRDTIAYGKLDAALNIGTYTHFVINLTPLNPGNPDTSLIWIQSSPRSPIATGFTGSVLRIDSISYTGIIGVDDLSPLVRSMLTYPVPAVNELNVRVDLVQPLSMNYKVMDVTGKILIANNLGGNSGRIDVSMLPSGNYFIQLHDDSGNKLISDKFTVVR